MLTLLGYMLHVDVNVVFSVAHFLVAVSDNHMLILRLCHRTKTAIVGYE